jgi:hypothetical protein
MRYRQSILLTTGLAVLVLTPIHAAVDSDQSAKTWTENAEELEEILRTNDVVTLKDVGTGITRPWKATLKKGEETLIAIFKPIKRSREESYQAEIAAYELDKLLGLNMVPPTVEREIRNQKGSLQLWVDNCILFNQAEGRPPKPLQWTEELSRMQTFDALIFNPDRNAGNFMIDPVWNIILIDHSQGFRTRKKLPTGKDKLPVRFDRNMFEKMKAFQLDALLSRLVGLLSENHIEALLARRDELVAHIEKLIAERGEDAVLF